MLVFLMSRAFPARNQGINTGITHERVELGGKQLFFHGQHIVISKILQCPPNFDGRNL
jgi:hypothetical protein